MNGNEKLLKHINKESMLKLLAKSKYPTGKSKYATSMINNKFYYKADGKHIIGISTEEAQDLLTQGFPQTASGTGRVTIIDIKPKEIFRE